MKRFQRSPKSNVKLVDPETFDRSELQRKFQAGEITFDQYMEGSATGTVTPRTESKSIRCGMCGDTKLQNGRPCPQCVAPLLPSATQQSLEGGASEVGPGVGPGRLVTAERALAFMLAGNATFTFRSTKTGERFTYKVSQAEPTPKYPDPAWFVAVLTGPENTSDYQYAGLIRKRGDDVLTFAWTGKSRFASTAPCVNAFRWTFLRLSFNRMPGNVEIWHEGRCGRCGRKLTVPESIAAGLGPECAGRV